MHARYGLRMLLQDSRRSWCHDIGWYGSVRRSVDYELSVVVVVSHDTRYAAQHQ
jgi:hypothetical protein